MSVSQIHRQGIVGRTWTCTLHGSHGTARPLRGAVHHVWPLGAGGPDVAENRIDVCETGHANLHLIMWELAHGRPAPKCARSELAYAKRGVAEWLTAGGVIGVNVPEAFLG